MVSTYLYSIASVIIVSLVSLAGIFTLSLKKEALKKYLFILISLAVGALLGDAFIHLIPETFAEITNPTYGSIAIIAGILIFFVLEKFLHWHHHAEGEEDHETIHVSGHMILISDAIHNFIDGLIIGASFLVSPELGITTTLAVILHEIPQEIGDFGVLIHSGYTNAKALWFNFLSALTAILGAIIALALNSTSELLMIWLVPITAGGFIYIAMSDLIPELHKTKRAHHSLIQLAAVVFGVCIMVLLLVLE